MKEFPDEGMITDSYYLIEKDKSKMIRRIFSMLAIAFLAVTTFIALPTTARAEGWLQETAEQVQQAFQEQYAQENNYSPNNDQSVQDNQYAQNSGQNSPNNDRKEQGDRGFSFFNNNQSNQDKGQNQQQSRSVKPQQ